jgi:hypothetical protein
METAAAPEFLSANLIALSKRDPHVANRLVYCPETAPRSQYSFLSARSGVLNIAYTDAVGIEKHLYSQYDPQREAETIARKNYLKTHTFFIVIGFGLGYHVGELFKLLSVDQHIIIVEPDRGLFREALMRNDYSPLLRDERVHCVCAPHSSRAIEKLKSIFFQYIERDVSSLGYGIISFYDRWQLYAAYARDIKQAVAGLLEAVQFRRSQIYAAIDALRRSGLGKKSLGEYPQALEFFRTRIISTRALTRAELGLLITYYLLSRYSYTETFDTGENGLR